MQFNSTLKKAWLGLSKILPVFLLLCFLGSTIHAQIYVNGNLSTGATSSNGVAAPAGTTWSEVQLGNNNGGYAASITASNLKIADDFVVPAGNTWNLTSIKFYGYQTGFAGATSPFTTVRVTIHSGSVTGPVVFGDQTTNRFASSADVLMYRIFNATTGTTRKVWSIDATAVVTLPAGNYWIEYATDVTGGAAHFLPSSTVVGSATQPGNNAQQWSGTAWGPLLDGTNAQDMPFSISYTSGPIVPCLGTPAPGNTITNSAAVCPSTGFTLSLQNTTPGAGVTYQWQSSSTLGGTYLPVVPAATGSTYTVSSISATTFYRAAVTCGGNTGISTPVQVTLNPPSACYCASTATDPADEDIFNVTFGTLNNASTCATTAPGTGSVTNFYSNYTGYTGAPTGNVFRGLPNSLSVQVGTCGTTPFNNGTAVFIDYNQDGDFLDAGERVYGLSTLTPGAHLETGNIIIPATASPGITRMRVITVEFTAGNAITPCGTYTWGETEDYNINIVIPPACTGTPAPGNTLSTAAAVCPSTTGFTLSLQNNPAVSGLTYQWFSAPTATGTFTAITGATASTYTVASLATATCYYAAVTCTGVTTNSSTLCITINPPNLCYCASSANSTADEEILNVTLGTLNNTSTCTTLAPGPGSIQSKYSNYTTYTGAPAAPNLIQGDSKAISIGVGTCGTFNYTNTVAIWIDCNQDGDFLDAGERVYTSAASSVGAHTESGNLSIPVTALLGVTRMRVISSEVAVASTILPCGGYGYGETEDYLVNITPCVPLTITTLPASTSTACGSNASFTVATTGTAPTYQWQVRVSATAPWQTVTNVAPYSNATTATLNITNASISLNGYQYRVIYTGGCTGSDFTAPVTLTVTALVAIVNPVSATICAGSNTIVPISIRNTGTVSTSTFSSAANLNITIPDNGSTIGVNNTINVTTLPGTSNIIGLKVKMNIIHSWVGDLIIVLKAPNGKIFNLAYALTGTGGAGGSTGFTNTVISSTPNPSTGLPFNTLVSGTNPYSNTFRADGFRPATGDPAVPTGPDTYIPLDATVFADLYGTVGSGNGPWTLAMYDYFDDATVSNRFVNWSIDISYAALSNGIFSSTPATPNTIYTDAAATTAYDGVTPVNTVYVKPNLSTVYSVAINTGTCTTTATVPVTVNTALVGTPTVANVSACGGSNAVFSYAGITAGTGLTFQWQVSTATTPAFSNIASATSANYTVTAATAAQSGNSYRVIITAAGCTGPLTSTAGTLTVNPIPVITINAVPVRNLYPGLTTTLVAVATAGSTYQWFRNTVAVAGATNKELVVGIDALGTYTVAVTSTSGCISTAATTTPSNIVIGDSSNTTRLFIYPSPNRGQFQVRFFNDIRNNGKAPGIVNVYDSKGVRVFNRSYTAGTGYQPMNVDLGANHGKGIYRVDLLTTAGERIKTGSVIVF